MSASKNVRDYFPKLCKPSKAHCCRLCYQVIAVGEECCRWSSLDPGEGYQTSHAHPECYQFTLDHDWDDGDWECHSPGDMDKPEKLEGK